LVQVVRLVVRSILISLGNYRIGYVLAIIRPMFGRNNQAYIWQKDKIFSTILYLYVLDRTYQLGSRVWVLVGVLRLVVWSVIALHLFGIHLILV
jgi:hypothetical protein